MKQWSILFIIERWQAKTFFILDMYSLLIFEFKLKTNSQLLLTIIQEQPCGHMKYLTVLVFQ